MRREYDYQKNEIDNQDGRIVVDYISCNCGMLAKRIRWKQTEYECKSCGRQYKLVFGGQYIEVKR